MLNLRFKVFVMQRNEKNKRTVLQVNTYHFVQQYSKDQRGYATCQQSEKRKNNNNEQWNLALSNTLKRKDCRKL